MNQELAPTESDVNHSAPSNADRVTQQHLCVRDWTFPINARIRLEQVPKYEELAPKLKALKDNGASILAIAGAHGISWQEAKDSIRFATTGKRPKSKSGKPTGTRKGTIPLYIQHAEEVARLHDQEKMPFKLIAEALDISPQTVQRAYDRASPDAVRKAAESGRRPNRGSYSPLGEEKHKRIRDLLATGMAPPQIARKVGCGASTVYRERLRITGGIPAAP